MFFQQSTKDNTSQDFSQNLRDFKTKSSEVSSPLHEKKSHREFKRVAALRETVSMSSRAISKTISFSSWFDFDSFKWLRSISKRLKLCSILTPTTLTLSLIPRYLCIDRNSSSSIVWSQYTSGVSRKSLDKLMQWFIWNKCPYIFKISSSFTTTCPIRICLMKGDSRRTKDSTSISQ